MGVRIPRRETWGKRGFVFAAIGSAVGIGNIWRFPYMVGSNGGGAFLIPYLIAVFAFGIPLMMLELGAGRHFRGSVVTALGGIHKKAKYVGIFLVILSLSILSYYTVISGWTLSYFIFSFTGYISFESFTSTLLPVAFFIFTLFITALAVSMGIKKGIEKLSTLLLPILFILIIVLAINSLFMPGAADGIRFYLTPDLSYLGNINTWLMAFGQVFFSLSIGYGILLTYASYMGKKDNIPKASAYIASADLTISLLAGLVIFPIIFSFGISPDSGSTLSFVALPQAFSSIAFGNIIGAGFFFLLFVAALTSSVSMLEVGVTSFVDNLKFTRKKAVAALFLIVLAIGMPSALSYSGYDISLLGMRFLDMMDYLFGSLLLLTAALICIAIAWLWRPRFLFFIEIGWEKKVRMPKILTKLVKYVIPFVLIVVFASGFIF